MNRPETSLITPDEVFDRYEYEFRKNDDLAPALKLYDKIVSDAVAKLPVIEKLWGKLVLKTLFVFALNGQASNCYQIAQAQMLLEDGNPSSGYERVARILEHFATCCPEALTTKGTGPQASYLFASAQQPAHSSLERQLATAVRDIAPDDPRLATILLAQGFTLFADAPAASSALPQLPPQTLYWRGSKRTVDVCLPGQEMSESQWRLLIAPLSLTGAQAGTAEKTAGLADGFLPELQTDDFTLTWEPAAPATPAGLQPLRRALALEELARAKSGLALTEEYRVLQEKVLAEVRSLFERVYLTQGTLKDTTQSASTAAIVEYLKPEPDSKITFQQFLAHAFDWLFSQQFPAHPVFLQPFTLEQANVLLAEFFLGTAAERQTGTVQQLAEACAEPLGIASRKSAPEFGVELYEPDIFSESAQQRPFVQAILSFLDQHAEETGVAHIPLIMVERLLSDSPYGLHRAAQYVLFGALLASNLIELVDEVNKHTLNKDNLTADFDLARFTAVRRMTSVSYPLTVLGEWARLLTGDAELPLPTSLENEQQIRESLRQWLTTWQQEQLRTRFEELPFDMMTLSAWRALNTSKTRFSRVSALVEAAISGRVELRTALSRIADIFGLDRASLTQMQNDMWDLCGFLDWMPVFSQIRNYLLVVEPTTEERIEALRIELLAQVQDASILLNVVSRQGLEAKFVEFRKRYSEFYAAAHEAEVGPSANRQLIATFCASPEWQRFRLLLELKLEGGAFERDAQALLKLAQETRCDLPVLELLQHQPHCCCTFRLHRQVHLGNLLDALKSIISAASTFYSLAIWRHRTELRAKVKDVTDRTFQTELESFLVACGSGDLSDLNGDLVTFINDCLAHQTSAANVA
ncbi:MAG: hypothetical protein U0Y68_01135 [Blastocatellia bacterium]